MLKFNLLVIMFFSLSIFTKSYSNDEFTIFPYETTELDLTLIMEKRLKVNFDNIKETKRSAGANIYTKVWIS